MLDRCGYTGDVILAGLQIGMSREALSWCLKYSYVSLRGGRRAKRIKAQRRRGGLLTSCPDLFPGHVPWLVTPPLGFPPSQLPTVT